jgi:hypothetical protein
MHFVGDEEFFGLAYLIGELIKKTYDMFINSSKYLMKTIYSLYKNNFSFILTFVEIIYV